MSTLKSKLAIAGERTSELDDKMTETSSIKHKFQKV